VLPATIPKADAMKIVCAFFVKFASLISWSLSCFDRVIFKGHLPITHARGLENFVDYELKMRRADFLKHVAPKWSDRLVEYAKGFARNAGRLYEYRQGDVDKDAWAKAQIQAHNLTEGLVGVLCVQETCSTFYVASGEGRPCYAPTKKPQRVL
jgi:hypothetical protein